MQTPDITEGTADLAQVVAEARTLAREQVAAAWQLHVDRVREQLEGGWREVVDQIFEQRFAEAESRLRAGFEKAVKEGLAAARTAQRRGLTEWLNGALRRLHQAETREVWIATVLDATAAFCGKAALFGIAASVLRLEGARGVEVPSAVEVPLSSAPAFGNAVDSLETVIAAGSAQELSEPIAAALRSASETRVYLFPISVRGKAVAVLYAEAGPEDVDVSALELLSTMTASTIENEASKSAAPQQQLVRIGGAAAAAQPRLGWSDLSKSEQETHLRAQRFARTRVSELLLHKVNQVRDGRASNNLYGTLKEEIDQAREAFREQFMAGNSSMVDYFHLELVRTLAKDDHSVLGVDYPGPLL